MAKAKREGGYYRNVKGQIVDGWGKLVPDAELLPEDAPVSPPQAEALKAPEPIDEVAAPEPPKATHKRTRQPK